MKKFVQIMILATGIYCLFDVLLNFDINQSIVVFGLDTSITISLLSRIIRLLFFIFLLIYVAKYMRKSGP